jgi:hypothetical protein
MGRKSWVKEASFLIVGRRNERRGWENKLWWEEKGLGESVMERSSTHSTINTHLYISL